MPIPQIPPQGPITETHTVGANIITLDWAADADSVIIEDYQKVNGIPDAPGRYSVAPGGQVLNFYFADNGQSLSVKYWPEPDPGFSLETYRELIAAANQGGGGGFTRAFERFDATCDAGGQLHLNLTLAHAPKFIVGIWGWDPTYSAMMIQANSVPSGFFLPQASADMLEAETGAPVNGVVPFSGDTLTTTFYGLGPNNPMKIWVDYLY